MIMPVPRRRPAKVARETATLDRLGNGRVVLGVGIGGDRFGRELSATGEQLDNRRRGQMLDELLQILTTAWSGESVHHRGRHYTIDVHPLRYVKADATWWMPEFAPEAVSQDEVRGVVRDGPLAL